MIQKKLFTVIERTTTVLVLLAAGVVLFQTAKQAIAGPAKPLEISTYKVGDSFPVLAGLDMKDGRPALVLYVRSTCKYCTASMDFYRRLTMTTPRSHRIVVVGPESKEVLQDYVSSHDVVPDVVLSVPNGTLSISGTPTLVSVEPSGLVGHVWRGKLGTAELESEVISTIAATVQRR